MGYLSSVQIAGITAEMHTNMDTGYFILFVTFVVGIGLGSVLGLMTHVFIIAVNVVDWRQGRSMTTSDQVIISITISKMALQFLIQIDVLVILFKIMYSRIIFMLMEIIFSSIVFSSIWFSTLLSIVLYLKISTLHNGVFLWLKKIITKNLLSLIAAIVLVSTIYSSLSTLIIDVTVSWNSTQLSADGHSEVEQAKMYLHYMCNILPFLICLLSSLLLITSLGCHISRMRHTQNSASSLNAYYRTIKYTIVSLLACALYGLLNILSLFVTFNSIPSNFFWILCTTLHSMYVIYVTSTLRKRLSRVLLHITNCLVRRREEPNSSEQAVNS